MRALRLILVVAALLPSALNAGPIDAKMFGGLHWREIGPYRGGRTRALAGVPTQPSTFYIAQVNGGIFKTTDCGHTWLPIFDREDSASIGSLAVAPSDPSVIYAGSGEGLQRPDLSTGNGIYKSTDAGKTWMHLGLREGQQIPRIAIDPRDPNRLFVAMLGHPYGPNPERGLYWSTDGGVSFEKVLSKDENTGANDVVIDPAHPDTIYTSFWEARQGPWENGAWSGTNGGVFKSTDGGRTWKPIMNGLPISGDKGFVQANLAIAPSETNRLYASVASMNGDLGIYRTDDGGGHWSKVTKDARPAARIGGGDLPVPAVDPKDSNTVYSASVVAWKSTDGGVTWTALRGAPGGDDYQGIWINPTQTDTMLVVSDQGAVVSVNGGKTWSNWYNQPTAQMYHVAADNAFPYRLCSGQQESGSACISSRGNDGQITEREWHPVGVEEYGNAVPDPLDPDIVYGGKVTRYDRRTGQVQNVGPQALRTASGYRVVRTAPLVFSPLDPHLLFFGANTLWKTSNNGHSWTEISPDLSRKTWSVPASVGKYRDNATAKPSQRGVIYAVAPSPVDLKCIWAGTDDGLVHVTFNGGASWKDVTPKQLAPWAKVSIIEASHSDIRTAYLAVNTFRLDDLRPHLYRTHDGGANWTEIINGIPPDAPTNVIREDPVRKGLLFTGTERAVYVSVNDGDAWQSLRLNMPGTSIRDLIVKNGDLVAATHGRGFWILDDISPLRQWQPDTITASAVLFRPADAIRVRWDMNTDTPLPPDVPAGENPPDGAPLDYYLGENSSGVVTLEILDASNYVVRKYSSDDPVPEVDPMLPIPKYWVRPANILSNAPGAHRFVWDLHYPPVPGQRAQYPMQAIAHETAPSSVAPWVMPGNYTVRLTAGGKTYSEPFRVRLDPRVKTGMRDLGVQFSLSKSIYNDLIPASIAVEQARRLRVDIEKREKAKGAPSESLEAFSRKLRALAGESGRLGGRGGAPGPDTLMSVDGALTALLGTLQEADALPTMQAVAATKDRRAALARLMTQWQTLQRVDLPKINKELAAASLQQLALLQPEQFKSDPPTSADDDERDVF